MKIERLEKPTFTVIGKEGSSADGEGSIQRLWEEANSHFSEVQPLARQDGQGNLAGIWGIMTDMTRSFLPWEEGFSKGLYLAGVECRDDAQPPAGWVKWTVPGYVCLKTGVEGPETFGEMLHYMEKEGLALAGAVHDFICPKSGKSYLVFPIGKL